MYKRICTKTKHVEELFEHCKEMKEFAVDTETVSLEDKTIIGMSVATDTHSWYIPVSKLPVRIFKPYIEELLDSEDYLKVFHNAKFDLKVFQKIGIGLKRYYDSMIMAWMAEMGKRQKFGLKTLAKEILHVDMTKYKEVDPDDLEKFADYAMDDTIYTLQLYRHYLPLLNNKMKKVLRDLEMPFVETLASMENRGIKIDVPALRQLKINLEKELKALKVDIIQDTVKSGFIPSISNMPVFNVNAYKGVIAYLNYRGIGVTTTTVKVLSQYAEDDWVKKYLEYKQLKKSNPRQAERLKTDLETEVKNSDFKMPLSEKKRALTVFNPSSNQQVKAYLDHIGIHIESTGVKELKKHKRHKWVSKMLKYRKISKMYTAFVEKMLPRVVKSGGRTYGSFNQIGTQTSRLSSSNINLQQLPSHDEYGYRGMFTASDGYKIILADYSQQESRVLAHLSKDKRMIEFFKAGHDLHSATAHSMFNLDCKVEDVKKLYPDERFMAKSINFGLAYGRGSKSLGEQLGVSQRKAEGIIDVYFQQFPSVKFYIKKVQAEAKRLGYVETLFGRRRYFPELKQLNNPDMSLYQIMGSVDRRSINTKIQGSSADITKKAMVDLYTAIKHRNDGAYILAQVHDEIVMECPESLAEDYKVILQTCMENAVKLLVPLTAEAEIADNWLDAKG